MSIFRNFPYSNFHEMNMDWIINKVKQLSEEWEHFHVDVIENIKNEVNTWLDDHPEATTTVEDGSLTAAKFTNDLQLHTLKDYVTPEMFGAVGDGVTDDSNALGTALNQGKPCYLSGTYILTQALTTDAPIIFGNGEIIANSGITYMITTFDSIIVSGIKFNSNDIGRGCIQVMDGHHAIVKDCLFTGYSATHGHELTDSLLIFSGVRTSFVDNCVFEDSGYDYGTNPDTLNRCLTHQYSLSQDAGKCFVTNCRFNHVNQAIVSTGNIEIANCSFTDISDNCFYLFGSALITNCDIIGDDEGAIIANGNYQFVNCYFRTGSISISINGNTDNLLVSNCRFDNEGHAIFSSRDNAYTIGTCKFNNCYFGMSGTLTTGYGSPIACLNVSTLYLFDNCIFDYNVVTNIIYNISNVKVIASNCIFKCTTATRLINNNLTAAFIFCDTSGVSLSTDLRTGIFTALPNQDANYQSACVVTKTARVLNISFSIKEGILTTSDIYVDLPKISSQKQVTTDKGNVFNYKVDGKIRLVTYAAPEDINAVINW